MTRMTSLAFALAFLTFTAAACGDKDEEVDCSRDTQSDDDCDGDGYTEEDGDCNDTDPAINPGADETCGDDIDQDCDGCGDHLDRDCEGITWGAGVNTGSNGGSPFNERSPDWDGWPICE